MSQKRSAAELDPDYEDISEQATKRQRRMEEDAKEASVLKIKRILRAQFKQEIEYKKSELDLIDQRLNQAQTMLDRLRACIIANYYSKTTQNKYGVAQDVPFIHPTVKKYLGKAPKNFPNDGAKVTTSDAEYVPENAVEKSNETKIESKKDSIDASQKIGATNNVVTPVTTKEDGTRTSRFKIRKRVIVGNVCKYIPVDKREGNDQATHKWMVYVRGPKEDPHLDPFVKKVWFFLHPSYRPNDLVEISQPPYHLTRRGWGEFPVRVQLHFHDTRNKKVDIIHHLKLDRTYTGLQTLGRETVVDIELDRESLHSNQEGEAPSRQSKAAFGSPRVKRKHGESRSSTPRTTPTPSQGPLGSPISHDPSPIAMIIQPVTPDPSPASTPYSATDGAKGFVTPTKHNGGASGWTHLQIKNEPSSPAPQVVRTPPTCADDMVVIGNITTVGSVKSEPASPQTPSSRRISISPGSQAGTPGKSNGNAGWMHLQIKSEPTSPVLGTVGSGWQSITNLTSPPKPGVNSPSTKSQSSPVFKPVTMQIGSIGSKTGSSNSGAAANSAANANKDTEDQAPPAAPTINISNSNFRVGDGVISQTIGGGSSELSQTIQFQLNPPAAPVSNTLSTPVADGVASSPGKPARGGLLVMQQQGIPGVVTPIAAANLTQGIKPSTTVVSKNTTPAAAGSSGQSTIYVKCVDNTGKIYLIPQHLLAKSPNSGGTPSPQVKAGQGQVVIGSPQLRGQALTPSSQVKGQGQIVIGASPNLVQTVIQKPGIRQASQVLVPAVIPASTLASTATPRPVAMTTPNKASPGGATQVILQMSPGQGQSSKVAIPVGPNMVFQVPVSSTPKTATQQGAQLKGLVTTSGVKGISTTTAVSQSITSQVSSVSESSGKTNNENVLIVGGNIVSMPGKQSLVLMTPDGKATSILPSVQSAKTAGAVSLLGSRKLPTVQGAQVKANTVLSPGGATSVLQKAVVGGANKPPGQVVFVHGGPKGQSLLTNKVVASQRAQSLVSNPRPSGAQSLLTTTVGNQTVILQLLPEQQGVAKATVNKTGNAVNQSNNGPSIAKTPAAPTVNSETIQVPNNLKETEKMIIPKSGQKNSLLKKDEVKEIKPQKEVQRKIFYQDFNLRDYDCFEKLLRTMVRTFPLIAENIDRNFHYYASSSQDEYLSWNVGKRRACEWQRASAVKKRIRRLLGSADSFHGEPVWTVRQIMIWCRAHCYTCLDNEISKKLTHEIRPLQSAGIQVDTYDDAEGLLQDLSNEVSETRGRLGQDAEDDEDDIDIIGEDEAVNEVKVKIESPVKTSVKTQMLPSSKEADDIQDITSEIGVRLRPVEVDPNLHPGVHGNLTHEVILSAMKSFAEDIVRKAASVIYEENRVADEVSVADVHKAIVAMDTCDFLTNAHLGVPTANMATP